MVDNINIEEIESILENSFNYEKVRRFAVNVYYRKNVPDGISEKCKIIFNPLRHLIIEYDYDLLIEKYFDYEKFDYELADLKAIEYKKAFVFALQYYYNNNELLK